MLFIAFISQKVWYLIYTLLSKNLFKIINSHALKTKKKKHPIKDHKAFNSFPNCHNFHKNYRYNLRLDN